MKKILCLLSLIAFINGAQGYAGFVGLQDGSSAELAAPTFTLSGVLSLLVSPPLGIGTLLNGDQVLDLENQDVNDAVSEALIADDEGRALTVVQVRLLEIGYASKQLVDGEISPVTITIVK